MEHYKEAPLLSSARLLCYFVCLFSVICSHQMKGLNFPGSHDPRFCQFVIDRSRHLLKPVRAFCWLVWHVFSFFLQEYAWFRIFFTIVDFDLSWNCISVWYLLTLNAVYDSGTCVCDYEHCCLLGCDVTSKNILDGPVVYLHTKMEDSMFLWSVVNF